MKKCKDHPNQNPYDKEQPKCWACLWNAKRAELALDTMVFDAELLFGEKIDPEVYREGCRINWEKRKKKST